MPRQPPQKERDAMRVVIQEDYRKMCKWAADYIAARIKAHGEDQYILFINYCPHILFDFSGLTKYAIISLPIACLSI